MKDEKRLSTKVYVIGVILLVIVTILAISGATGGMTGSPNSNVEGVKNYSSIDDMINHIGFSIDMPNFVYNYNGKILGIQSTMGQVVEIDTEDFVFKASPLVSYNADILGMYEHTDSDFRYLVENNEKIRFIRYRHNYPSYEHCTIIDWCTDETTHGLIVGSILSEEDILSIFEIDKSCLKEITQEEIIQLENGTYSQASEEVEPSSLEYDTYTIGNKFTVDIPKFASTVNVIDEGGIAKFYIDKKLIFVIIYNDYDIATDAFSGQSEEQLADGIVLKYKSENPFDQGHIDYQNYNRFIKTIDYIKKTIVYL